MMTGRLQKSVRPKAVFQATRLCNFYLQGRCTRGAECAFAHGDEQLRGKPDFYKTRFCEQFSSKGFCKDQESCCFAHSAEELRGPRREQELKQAMSNIQNGGLKRRGRCSNFKSKSKQALANLMNKQAPFSMDVLQPGLYSRRASNYQDDLESLSTDCMSECNTPFFSRTSSAASQDYIGSHEQAWGDKMQQPTPQGWPNTQFNPQPDEMYTLPLGIPEYPGGRIVVKNTFLHLESESTECARNRSRSCHF